jgi:hypothetical protein
VGHIGGVEVGKPRPELPPEIDAIVMKALAKRLEDRYQSAAAMRSDIERRLGPELGQAAEREGRDR